MNKKIKYGLIGLGVILLGFGGFLGIYRLQRIQGTVSGYEINAKTKEQKNAIKAIIYTQDRGFKNEVIDDLKQKLVDENVYVKVEPVEEIGNNKIKEWDKVVILATIQSSEPPKEALDFINQHKKEQKLGIYLTGDSGQWSHQPNDVDATTAASKTENIALFSQKINDFLLKK
ncbi:hypothetical protein ACWOC1_07570 [Enterococcus quebecensis]|uniref:Flavodoxin n=1 Tax=Enterococcus quebecensis TaxID=903983 RepID=A0A1E5H3R2_9ENTE|nr:hypothetical protein [Enterococcus quebecensis]OEG19551.1 hypothetical protein BCR23_02345 [Enterococcus quebecensis]